jgi:hypothetical protein
MRGPYPAAHQGRGAPVTMPPRSSSAKADGSDPQPYRAGRGNTTTRRVHYRRPMSATVAASCAQIEYRHPGISGPHLTDAAQQLRDKTLPEEVGVS